MNLSQVLTLIERFLAFLLFLTSLRARKLSQHEPKVEGGMSFLCLLLDASRELGCDDYQEVTSSNP